MAQGKYQHHTPLMIIITYILVSGIWIAFSDRLLSVLVSDSETFTRLSTLKGWLFVIITAFLLYSMIQRYTLTLQQTQARLAERENWYKRLITTAEEGIWVLDTEHRITFANQRLAEMLGYTAEELLNRSVFDFIDPAWFDETNQHLHARLQGTHEEYETLLRSRDGTARWVISSAAPILDAKGEITSSFAMLTDITERHQLEDFQREFARKTIEAATDGKLLIRTRDEIIQLAGPALKVQTIQYPEDLEIIRHLVADSAHGFGMEAERVFDYLLCISEVTTNVVKHTNGGTFSLHKNDEILLAVTSDQGPGILAINLPEIALKPGYTTSVSLGMGYKAMISLADKVYLATGPGGTTVAIAMGIRAPIQAMPRIPTALAGSW